MKTFVDIAQGVAIAAASILAAILVSGGRVDW